MASANLVLCDAAGALAVESPAGICGQESFYEHVHLCFDGNYRLAGAWAAQVERLLPEPIKAAAPLRAGLRKHVRTQVRADRLEPLQRG